MATTTLNIPWIDTHAAECIKRAAHERGLTISQYVARIAELHHRACALADTGDKDCAELLKRLGLETVPTRRPRAGAATRRSSSAC
jgi:hypothetical protein